MSHGVNQQFACSLYEIHFPIMCHLGSLKEEGCHTVLNSKVQLELQWLQHFPCQVKYIKAQKASEWACCILFYDGWAHGATDIQSKTMLERISLHKRCNVMGGLYKAALAFVVHVHTEVGLNIHYSPHVTLHDVLSCIALLFCLSSEHLPLFCLCPAACSKLSQALVLTNIRLKSNYSLGNSVHKMQSANMFKCPCM